MNRRQFLSLAGASVATGAPSANDRIQVGVIGVGGMGSGHVRAFHQLPEAKVIAVCDVKRDAAAKAAESAGPDCKTHSDFRELLARPDIDAVVIATPDHWHVPIGMEAARRGKHMYYEKPMSRSIAENKAFRDVINRYGVVFQFGTQQRSDAGYRWTCEMARNGRLGQIKHLMVGAATAPYSPDMPTEPVPDTIDYDMWLGPAPWAPYNSRRVTRDWTHIYDYSLGCLGSAWGVHDVDIAQWALDMDASGPVKIEATGEFPKEGLFDTARAFDAVMTYRNGAQLHLMDMPTALRKRQQFRLQWMSMLFEGTEGWILVSRNGLHAHPRSLLREVIGPNEKQLPRSNNHRKHFLDCIRTRSTPISPLESAVRSDTVCHLADIAMRVQRPVEWNPEKEEFVSDAAANRMMYRPYRSPWRLS